MRTLYYLIDTLDAADGVATTLRHLNIDDNGYYIVSRDRDGLRRHHLHDASVMEETDLIHSGERGALIGGLCGLLLALWVALAHPFGLSLSVVSFLLICVFIGCFGAWVGGMVGISHEHYKLAPFHDAIAAGKYLMAITVRTPAKSREIKQTLYRRHPQAVFEAEDALGMDVFASKAEFHPRHL